MSPGAWREFHPPTEMFCILSKYATKWNLWPYDQSSPACYPVCIKLSSSALVGLHCKKKKKPPTLKRENKLCFWYNYEFLNMSYLNCKKFVEIFNKKWSHDKMPIDWVCLGATGKYMSLGHVLGLYIVTLNEIFSYPSLSLGR